MTTATSWISKRADCCGGDACIRDTRIPVWVLEGYRRLDLTDEEIIRCYPSLTTADLETAWEYATGNVDKIDRAIADNEEVEEGFVE